MTWSNCVIFALFEKAKNPAVRIGFIRNRHGRLHCIWTLNGKRYEFYAKGRSSLPYWKNIIYRGYKKEI